MLPYLDLLKKYQPDNQLGRGTKKSPYLYLCLFDFYRYCHGVFVGDSYSEMFHDPLKEVKQPGMQWFLYDFVWDELLFSHFYPLKSYIDTQNSHV